MPSAHAAAGARGKTRFFPDLFRAPGGAPPVPGATEKARYYFLAGCVDPGKECLPAGRAALEKCKKPRTGRGFLRIDRGRAAILSQAVWAAVPGYSGAGGEPRKGPGCNPGRVHDKRPSQRKAFCVRFGSVAGRGSGPVPGLSFFSLPEKTQPDLVYCLAQQRSMAVRAPDRRYFRKSQKPFSSSSPSSMAL